MATNNRPLKAYVRFDGSGRAVSSSLIWRKNKPKVGNWKEVQGYECCDTFECIVPAVTLSTTATGFPALISDCIPYVVFKCDASTVWELFGYIGPVDNPFSLEDYIERLNESYSWVGVWSLDGTIVTLEMNGGVAKALCPTGELTMIISTVCPA